MEKIINVKVSGSEIEQSSNYGGIQGEGGARILKISFDDEWTELSKSVTFFDVNMKNPVKVMLTTLNKNTDGSYSVPIPKEPLKEGERFTYIIDGSTDGALQRSVKKELKVKYAPVSGSAAAPEDITPSLSDQLNLSIQHESKRTDALEEKMTAAEETILQHGEELDNHAQNIVVIKENAIGLQETVNKNKEESDAWKEALLDFYLPFLLEGYAASEEQAKEGTNNENFLTPKTGKAQFDHFFSLEFDSRIANVPQAIGGINDTNYLTPKTGKAQIEHILTNEGFPVIKENITILEEENKSFMYYGDSSIKPSDSSFFEFITDDETMTASVMISSVDLEVRDIVIPYEYVVDDKVYKVTSIADNGFLDYSTLESVVMPNSVIEIGKAAFSGCYELRRINLPPNITTIPERAFEDCINLFDVTILEGVEKISLAAFINSALESITIPKSMVVIDELALDAPALADVYFKGTKEQWGAITIKENNDPLLNATIHYDWIEEDAGTKYTAGEGINIDNDIITTDNSIIQVGENLYVESMNYTGYMSVDGSLVYSFDAITQEKISDYIPVTEGEQYTIQEWLEIPSGQSAWTGYGYYDSNYIFISPRYVKTAVKDVVNGISHVVFTITVPTGAKYLRVSARTFGSNKIKIEKGNTPTAYKMAREDVVNHRGFPKGYSLATVAGSLNGYVTFNSDVRSVMIPADTLIYYEQAGKRNFISSASATTLTIPTSTSLWLLWVDIRTKKFALSAYSNISTIPITGVLVSIIRISGKLVRPTILGTYVIDGKLYGINADIIDYDFTVKSVNHRGYNTVAPENTISAFKLSKQYGFKYVECDVNFTSDGVPVLLHDDTVDRTSDGTGNISDLTFEQVRAMDFGSWKSTAYAGEKIPTFEEFIVFCKRAGLYPYIEIKSAGQTQEQIASLVEIVNKCGMKGKVTWISFNATSLSYIKNVDSTARLGYVVGEITTNVIDTVKNTLKTDNNEVFVDCLYNVLNSDQVALCVNDNIPLEVWTVNSDVAVLALDNYISGVTSNSIIAGKAFYNEVM